VILKIVPGTGNARYDSLHRRKTTNSRAAKMKIDQWQRREADLKSEVFLKKQTETFHLYFSLLM
jgi:hypothetical protein